MRCEPNNVADIDLIQVQSKRHGVPFGQDPHVIHVAAVDDILRHMEKALRQMQEQRRSAR